MPFLMTLLGVLFVFFIPGFLITIIFFKESELLEKIILSILLSIGFYVILGIFLGFNETMKNITGGLTKANLWIYSIVINLVLVVVYFMKNRKQNSHKKKSKK